MPPQRHYGKETHRREAGKGDGIYHKKRKPREAAECMRGRRRFRQPQAFAVRGADRPGIQRLCERNHSPGRHGGQARRDALAPQRSRHARGSRVAGRARQGARLPRPRVPRGRQVGGQAAERNGLLRSGHLLDRGEGQAARGRVAGRARGGRRDGGGVSVRPDEKREGGGAASTAQAHAVGASALRPDRWRRGRGAWPRHRARHGLCARPGQPSRQRLHADVPGRTGAGARARVPRHQGDRARAQGNRSPQHGTFLSVTNGAEPPRSSSSSTRRTRASRSLSSVGKGITARQRRHCRPSPASTWTR